MIVGDAKVVKGLLATFEVDWAASGFEETRETMKGSTEVEPKPNAKASRALAKEMPPLKTTLKKASSKRSQKAWPGLSGARNLKST